MRAEILTPWIGDSTTENPNRPKLGDDYAYEKWVDITAQPAVNLHPDPNLYAVLVEVDAATLESISWDPRYFILWQEE